MKPRLSREALAKMIEQTNLKPTATSDEIAKMCEEAKTYGFGAVCVAPCHVPLAVSSLKGSEVRVVTVAGFPLGSASTRIKELEAKQAVLDGADEIDMVMNIGMMKAGDERGVMEDIRAVVKAARGKKVKVIIETCYLTDEEKVKACELAAAAGASFVKTSTGFGPAGATAHDVKLMRKAVGTKIGIKASGGIRTLKQALELIEVGADRIGTSAGVEIIRELGI